MKNKKAYDLWAGNYDTVINATRDIEALAFRKILEQYNYTEILEIGCGTGKNTEWLVENCHHITAVDFSTEMLNRAKQKITSGKVKFIQADINNKWDFTDKKFELITFSLILEHISNIHHVFQNANKYLVEGGLLYLGELHPIKQYMGSKARFDTSDGIFELECYVHHFSDYLDAANENNFECIDIQEWFDNNDRNSIPRILTLLFRKKPA